MTKQETIIHNFAKIKGGEVFKYGKSSFVLYELCAAEWTHNTKRPSSHYRFKTEKQRAQWIEQQKAYIDKQTEAAQRYEAQMNKDLEAIKEGAILYDSWGYEQTNIDFYKVIKRSGVSVTLLPIGSHVEQSGFMSGNASPDESNVVGDPIVRRAGKYGVRIASHRGTLTLYDGRPKCCSWYA